ncbi:unnamed protein product [Dibothriocephalus latus]|uniref:Uncharacterized protein n=1 Tax=Dibothriocephalus latus TaxID=60516 RepID=A0A3P7KWA6_DIBLA|nr:unnamed protein product [Dibothriocephalus latus]
MGAKEAFRVNYKVPSGYSKFLGQRLLAAAEAMPIDSVRPKVLRHCAAVTMDETSSHDHTRRITGLGNRPPQRRTSRKSDHAHLITCLERRSV